MNNKVTIITATTGNPRLKKCIESVAKQTHKDVEHLVVIDGPRPDAERIIFHDGNAFPPTLKVLRLPYSIGKDRWNGHRIYGGASFMAEGQFVMFLDDDNYLEPTHIEDCLKVIEAGNTWTYSFRKIVDAEGNTLCNDDCESLGKWASILHSQDYFIDVNCYFLPTPVAVGIAPVWYRKFREPNQPEVDRVLYHVLRNTTNMKHDATYNYTVNYTVGNTPNSVQADFFLNGNDEMLRRYNGRLPWKKS
jgi:glycosyltransferase involved in cell wall biosynthesis